MSNEPIFSNNPNESKAIFSDASATPTERNARGFRTPQNNPNPKHLGIGIAIAVVLAAVGIYLLLPKDTPVRAGEFNENAKSSREVEGKNPYVELVGFDLTLEEISPYTSEEITDKISKFFTYVYPDISTLTLKNTEVGEASSPEETSDEEDPITTKTYSYHFAANNGKNFTANIIVTSNLSGCELVILDSANNEIYTYKSGTIPENAYYTDAENLLDAIITFLPHSGEAASGEKFDITFEGDSENRLTISAESETSVLSAEACQDALEKAVSWVNSLSLDYTGEISASNFICE